MIRKPNVTKIALGLIPWGSFFVLFFSINSAHLYHTAEGKNGNKEKRAPHKHIGVDPKTGQTEALYCSI